MRPLEYVYERVDDIKTCWHYASGDLKKAEACAVIGGFLVGTTYIFSNAGVYSVAVPAYLTAASCGLLAHNYLGRISKKVPQGPAPI